MLLLKSNKIVFVMAKVMALRMMKAEQNPVKKPFIIETDKKNVHYAVSHKNLSSESSDTMFLKGEKKKKICNLSSDQNCTQRASFTFIRMNFSTCKEAWGCSL